MKKRVLVCGARGFIGRNIFETLFKRDDLEVFGTFFHRLPPFYPRHTYNNLFYADLTKKESMNIVKNMDVVIQAAGVCATIEEVNRNCHSFINHNIFMNSLLIEAAHEHSVPQFIFISCPVVYPKNMLSVKEDGVDLKEIHPKYFAGAKIKLLAEDMSKFYSSLGRTKFTVIRHSSTYGPYDKYDISKSHVFAATITKVLQAQQNDKIIIWGDGKERKDLLYVSDLLDFIGMVIDGQDYDFDIFNVGQGKSISITDLTRKVIELSGKNLEIAYDTTKPTIKVNWSLDCTKALAKFGWFPKVGLEDGIRKTIAWCRLNGM